jgi:hypothetical protein
MWVYVLYLAIGPGRAESPDRLANPAFATAAEARCAAALDLVGELQPAPQAANAAERADVLAIANGHFTDMVDDLEDLVHLAPAGDDREIVQEWLADWRVYLDDRDAYARELRVEPKSRLLVTAKDGQQITDYVDEFAKDNRMPACSTPLDAA